jgi:hypothetical protein
MSTKNQKDCVLQQPGHNAPRTEYLDQIPREEFKSRIDHVGKGVFRIGFCHCDARSICEHLYSTHNYRDFQAAYEARKQLGIFEVSALYPATKLLFFEATEKYYWLKGNLGYPAWDAPRFPVDRFERNGPTITLVTDYVAAPINMVCMDSAFEAIAQGF